MSMRGKNATNVITVDGPAGSGKSTISRLLAKRINWLYLDTGAMYRAVAYEANKRGANFSDGKELGAMCRVLVLRFKTDEDPPRLFSGNEDISRAIRSSQMDMLSSKVSAVKEVREEMVSLQRKMAEGVKLVAEGRDMGTVVFPRARYKFYIMASHEVRAQRRYRERLERGESISKNLVEEELRQRDWQDQTRSLAPLKPANDAILIDSTEMTPEEVIAKMLSCLGSGFRS